MTSQTENRERGSSIGPVTLSILGLAGCYVLLFVLVFVDEVVLKTHYVRAALYSISPNAYDIFGEYFRMIYAPLIWAVKRIGWI